MHAIILSGGRGTRLRPITDCIPKALVPIGGKPILEWQVRMLSKAGIRDITVSTGYMAEQIEGYLESRGGFGSNVSVSVEKTPLGTGGAIKRAGRLVGGGSFLVLNGDVLTDIPIRKLLKVSNSLAAVQLPTKYGLLDIDDGSVQAFSEKGVLEDRWINAGIYHLEKKMLADMPAKGNIENTTFPKYAKAGMLHAVKFDGARWYSIDSHKDMENCSSQICDMI